MSMRGMTMLEILIVLGILGAVLAGTSHAIRLLESVDGHLATKDDIATFRFLTLRQMDCRETASPGGVLASACNNVLPLGPGETCEAREKLSIYGRFGSTSRIMIDVAGKSLGQYRLRACCPAGQPIIEVRKMSKLSAVAQDRLTGKVHDWQPLFSTPLCGRLNPPPLKPISVAKAAVTLKTPLAICPGLFRNVPSLAGPENILNYFDATVSCPPGTRVVGGGVDCSNMGFMPVYTLRSVVVDSHPRLEDSPTGKMGDSSSYVVSCCGSIANAVPKVDRAYVLCEKI